MADGEDFDLFGAARPEQPKLPAEGLKRYLQLGVKGATLGYAGTQIPAQNLPEAAAEFAGSIPTVGAISAVTSPLGAAAARTVPLLRAPAVLPIASRMIGATATGAIVGGTEALVKGEPPLTGAATGAAQFGAAEGLFIGAGKLLGRALKVPPAGKTLTPSPVENPVAAEVAAGQGLAPEHPPNLNLPVVRSSGIFDAKDFTGSGTVLNPERNPQLRGWRFVRPPQLPEGTSQYHRYVRAPQLEGRPGPPTEPYVDAPEWVRIREGEKVLPPGPTEPRALPEASGKVGHVAAPETDFPWEPYFAREYDPKVGQEVFVPKAPEVEEALTIAQGTRPQTEGELPLSPAQVQHLEANPELKARLDTETNREPMLTDNLLKQPEDVVQNAVESGAASPTIEAHSVELTPAGLEARTLLERSGIPEDEYVKFGSTLRGTRDQKMGQLLAWLRERCK